MSVTENPAKRSRILMGKESVPKLALAVWLVEVFPGIPG